MDELGASAEDAALLTSLLVAAGLPEAIDAAFIDESMVAEILGDHAERLRCLLMKAKARARPMVAAWVKRGTRPVVGGGVRRSGCDTRPTSSAESPPGPGDSRVGRASEGGGQAGSRYPVRSSSYGFCPPVF